MRVSIQRCFLVSIGLLLCVFGCTRDRAHVLMPDDISSPMDTHESVDVAKAAFEQNVLPILAVKCAFSGCHGENPQEGYDYRTYESFIAGGEHGPVFIPGNAEESEIVKEIVEGKMPPPASGLPTLSETELQALIDWIHQQEPHDDIVLHDDDHDAEEDAHGDIDDAHDEDMDDAHDEDVDDDAHGDIDNGHDEDNNDDHDEDDDH